METVLENFEEALRRATRWSIVVAICAIACGVLAVASPALGAYTAGLALGLLSIVAGCFELSWAWRTRRLRGAVWRFLLAAAYLVFGAYVMANPAVGMITLAIALGVYLLARGVGQLILGYEARATHVWGWFVLDGAVCLFLGGVLLLAGPIGSILYLGLYVGLSLIMNGLHRIMIAAQLRKLLPPPTRQAPPLTAAHA